MAPYDYLIEMEPILGIKVVCSPSYINVISSHHLTCLFPISYFNSAQQVKDNSTLPKQLSTIMYTVFTYVACLSLLAPKLLAAPAPAPAPQAFGGSSPVCVEGKKYKISKQATFAGKPRLVAGEQCSANVGGVCLPQCLILTPPEPPH